MILCEAAIGLRAFFVTGSIYLVLALPGLAWARKLPGGIMGNPGLALSASFAGVAASLVLLAVAGTLLQLFSLCFALATPVCLMLVVHLLAKPTGPGRSLLQAGFFYNGRTSLVILGTVVLLLYVFSTVGKESIGLVHYTAFFNADFFKHLSVSQSIALHGLPPQDPFSAGNRLYYYWLFYLIPAVAHKLDLVLPGVPASITALLLSCSIIQAVALLTLLGLACLGLGASRRASALAVMLAIASLSLDGLTSLWLHRDNMLDAMKYLNVEALDLSMAFGVEIWFASSSFFRLCLYVQQHQLATCLLVAWVILFSTRRAEAARGALALAIPSVSLFVGAISCAAIFLAEGALALGKKSWKPLLPLVCVVLSIATYLALDMIETSTTVDTLTSSFSDQSGRAFRVLLFPLHWLTSFGVLGALGVWGAWHTALKDGHWEPALLIGMGAASILASMTLLTPGRLGMNVELKASYVIILGLTMGAAAGFTHMTRRPRARRLAFATVAAFGIMGLPSFIHDVVWHTTNHPNATVSISVYDWEALAWMRENTPEDAVVQQWPEKPFLRMGKGVWVPTFAGRALRTSYRGTAPQEVQEQALALFTPGKAPKEYTRLAKHLQLDYVYLSWLLQPNEFKELDQAYKRAGWERVYGNDFVGIWKTPF